MHLQDRWNRDRLQLRRKYSKEPQLIDLTNFVEDEMTLVNDPLYSRNAVSQYVNRAPRYSEKRERKKLNAMETVADNSCHVSHDKSNKVASKVEVCPMILKIALTIYSKQWKKEASSFSKTNYVMDA